MRHYKACVKPPPVPLPEGLDYKVVDMSGEVVTEGGRGGGTFCVGGGEESATPTDAPSITPSGSPTEGEGTVVCNDDKDCPEGSNCDHEASEARKLFDKANEKKSWLDNYEESILHSRLIRQQERGGRRLFGIEEPKKEGVCSI